MRKPNGYGSIKKLSGSETNGPAAEYIAIGR